MTRLALADNRLRGLAGTRRSDRDATNSRHNGYRFGRLPAKPIRAGSRAARGAKRFFSAMLAIIAEARLRRLARELSLRGVSYESVRPDGDRFVANPDRSSSNSSSRSL
jgi:hypothetical protein